MAQLRMPVEEAWAHETQYEQKWLMHRGYAYGFVGCLSALSVASKGLHLHT